MWILAIGMGLGAQFWWGPKMSNIDAKLRQIQGFEKVPANPVPSSKNDIWGPYIQKCPLSNQLGPGQLKIDLSNLYSKYAEFKNWLILLPASATEIAYSSDGNLATMKVTFEGPSL
jgi:hypothetical protein